MANIPEKYQKLHKLSFENKDVLQKSKKCICFYCCGRFEFSKIKNWIEDANNLTAQCPNCDIDSVIPAVIEGKEITNEEIDEMNKYYF